MKRVLYTSCAGLLALCSTAPALAADQPLYAADKAGVSVEQVGVRYGDLDLATTSGAAAMLARIEEAASDACGGNPGPANSGDVLGQPRRNEYRRCRIAAIDVATIRLAAPLVRAAWLERGDAALAAKARKDSAALLKSAGLRVPAELLAADTSGEAGHTLAPAPTRRK